MDVIASVVHLRAKRDAKQSGMSSTNFDRIASSALPPRNDAPNQAVRPGLGIIALIDARATA